MRKRYFASRPKGLPKGYDSKLELRLHEGALREAQHHPDKSTLISYEVPHTYEYDFMFTVGDTMYLAESKGRFRDSTEASKYKHIREHLDNWGVYKYSDCSNIELFFIFENSKTAYPFAKRRKDGTKQSHGEWATKNGFRWLCEKRKDLEGIDSSVGLVEKLKELN